MTVQQLLAERIKGSSPATVAAEIGITERELKDFRLGIALGAAPASRLDAWCRSHAGPVATPSQKGRPEDVPRVPKRVGPRDSSRRNEEWGFVRRAGESREDAEDRVLRPGPDASRRATGQHGGLGAGTARPAVDWEDVRSYVRRLVEEFSIRIVCEMIGPPVRRGALHQFINGSTPHRRNAEHLATWYTSRLAAALAPPVESTSWRDVPVDVLRRYFQAEAEITSIRAVAKAAGVVYQTLAKFLTTEESVPHPRIRKRLATYYLKRGGRVTNPAAPRDSDPRPVQRRGRPRTQRSPRAPRQSRSAAKRGGIPFVFPVEEVREHVLTCVERGGVPFMPVARCIAGWWIQQDTPPGASDPACRAEYRAVSVDTLLAFYREEVERGSIGETARSVGVSYDSLRRFVKQGEGASHFLAPRIRRLLALHYLRRVCLLEHVSQLLRVLVPYAPAVLPTPRRSAPPRPEDPSLEELRSFYRAEFRRGTATAVAAGVGVSVATATTFTKGVVPLRATRRRFVAYYQQRRVSLQRLADLLAGLARTPRGFPRPTLAAEKQRLEPIRAFARERAAAVTPAVVIAEIGISMTAFYDFLRGSVPWRRNRAKLEDWYARASAKAPARVAAITDEVPTPTLRAFFASALSRGESMSGLAQSARLGPVAFERFIMGAEPSGAALSQLRTYYREHSIPKTRALEALLEDLAGHVRTRAFRRILSAVARGYREVGLAVPGWVDSLLPTSRTDSTASPDLRVSPRVRSYA